MKLADRTPREFSSPFQDNSPIGSDRRRNLRKPLEMSIFCQKVGNRDGRLLSGNTVNVSPGGVLVNMSGAALRGGELVSVEMAAPPGIGLLEQIGRFSSYARVVRVDDPLHPADNRKQIALEFCESPKFSF